MSGVQQCRTSSKVYANAEDNGALAGRWFDLTPEGIEAKEGRFTKGKNKGKLRGWIVARRVDVGGWCYPTQSVLRPGMIFAMYCQTYEDMSTNVSLPTDKFMAWSQRVDSQYGYDRKVLAAEAAERGVKAVAEAAESERQRKIDTAETCIGIMQESVDRELTAAEKALIIRVASNYGGDMQSGDTEAWAVLAAECGAVNQRKGLVNHPITI